MRRLAPAVAGDQPAHELKEVGVVSHDEDSLAVSVLRQHVLKSRIVRFKRKRGADFHLGFVAKLGADKLGGLQGPLQRARDDDVDLDFERAQNARHQHALVLAFLDQSSFFVEKGIDATESGIGVAHEVKVHRDEGQAGEIYGRASSLPR